MCNLLISYIPYSFMKNILHLVNYSFEIKCKLWYIYIAETEYDE